MATYSRRELHITRVEFTVPAEPPWGATWVEVAKAITAATNEIRAADGLEPDEVLADDRISVAPYNEDEIVVSYELRARMRADTAQEGSTDGR